MKYLFFLVCLIMNIAVSGLFQVEPLLPVSENSINVINSNSNTVSSDKLNYDYLSSESSINIFLDSYSVSINNKAVHQRRILDNYDTALKSGRYPQSAEEVAIGSNLVPVNSKIGDYISVVYTSYKTNSSTINNVFTLSYKLVGILRNFDTMYTLDSISEQNRLSIYDTLINFEFSQSLSSLLPSLNVKETVLNSNIERSRMLVSQKYLDENKLTIDDVNANSKSIDFVSSNIFKNTGVFKIENDFELVTSSDGSNGILYLSLNDMNKIVKQIDSKCFSARYSSKSLLKKDLASLENLGANILNKNSLNELDKVTLINAGAGSIVAIELFLLIGTIFIPSKRGNQNSFRTIEFKVSLIILNLVSIVLSFGIASFLGLLTFSLTVTNLVIFVATLFTGLGLYIKERGNKKEKEVQ